MNHAPENIIPLTDVQAQPDKRRLAIDKVGVKDIRYPIQVKDRKGGEQRTVATINMYVNLPHHFKGTHMSRFLEVLANYDDAISIENLPDLLSHIQKRLSAEQAFIELDFPYFVQKSAPVSGAQALMDYQVRLVGKRDQTAFDLQLEIMAPVTSLCPCSKEISRYGAHNQRSHVTVQLKLKQFVWIEEIIEIIERNASCDLFPILKRPDEKYVTEKAFENPCFVEDIVRNVAMELKEDSRIGWYAVESENFESIHNHSAYAFIQSHKEN
ncbi:GTP cyclohydrolase FolE2 [Magnetococcales bacterium HHB-1]